VKPPERPLEVLVVDDSAVARQTLAAVLGRDGTMRVTTAVDPVFARQKMAAAPPDVIVLDLEMPRLDGLTWLRRLMAESPLPVVVCSAFSGRFARAAIQALESGAVDVIQKPRFGTRDFLEESAALLVDTVRAAARARVRRRPGGAAADREMGNDASGRPPDGARGAPPGRLSAARPEAVVAVGASTGGTEALRSLLGALPADAPPVVVVQHMPEGFTRAFAERLDECCALAVKEAESGDRLRAGQALVARGNRHLLVHRAGGAYIAELADGPLVSRHRPSVDVLFESVARSARGEGVGVLLTGMGSDGAKGLLAMRRAGAFTVAQDEATSVVFGMPREAIALGGAEVVAPLGRIASIVLAAVGV
jgi:two-component system chemotaxis response regulator CheB